MTFIKKKIIIFELINILLLFCFISLMLILKSLNNDLKYIGSLFIISICIISVLISNSILFPYIIKYKKIQIRLLIFLIYIILILIIGFILFMLLGATIFYELFAG